MLLATHNGRRWLPDQLDSILAQEGVELRVIALDDASTDGTVDWLRKRMSHDARLVVLPSQGPAGGAAANFYRLILSAPGEQDELIAFADQDDIWVPGKLARHAALIAAGGFDGISSNVTSFTRDGKRTLIRKSFPQRDHDYLLESPGPGSTFLMTPRLVALAKDVLTSADGLATRVDYHDCLIYAIARARGWSWHIDDLPSVDYRQHSANVLGANVGLRPAVERWRLIRSQWHRNQAIIIAKVCLGIVDERLQGGLLRMHDLMVSRRFRDRWRLSTMAGQLRRRPRDRWIIGLLIAVGAW